MADLFDSVKSIWTKYPVAFGACVYGLIAALYGIFTNGLMPDDAYIFIQYAENLTKTGMLAFNPGEESYGITSLTWTLLLALCSYLPIALETMSKALGILLSSIGVAFWAKWAFDRTDIPASPLPLIIAALIPTIGPGRMIVGMEPPLLCLLSGILVYSYGRRAIPVMGVSGGLLILTRPDMSIVVFVLFTILAFRQRIRQAIIFAGLAGIIALPWHAWLYYRIGHILPPTRVGKLAVFLPDHLNITLSQFESGTIVNHLIWSVSALKAFAKIGFSSLAFLGLVTAAILVSLFMIYRRKSSTLEILLLPTACIISSLAAYCVLFPLLKLRYFVWISPALIIGIWLAGRTLFNAKLFHRLSLIAVCGFLLLLYPALKRQIYSTEMVKYRLRTGIWLSQNTPPDARIALEPIGQIGYASHRYIVDMGGLTNTETQPYIVNGFADTTRILQCLADFSADYLVTYDHDGYLGALIRDCPDHFEQVAYIPEQPVENLRYRVVRIIKK
ncbi:MAG: hypothetical protein R3F48_12875 [Candidatus Zixiibacteriota bacterium]